MTVIQPTFPHVIDASMRSTWVACQTQWFYSHILNLRKPAPSIHLHFGGCIASALESTRKAYWRDGFDEIDSISRGVKTLIEKWSDFEIPPSIENTRAGVKDLAGCIDALVSYFEQWPLAEDLIKPLFVDAPNGTKELMVEKSFAIPIDDGGGDYIRHPETEEPLLYAGRFDMLGRFQDAIFVEDDKTALVLGESWRSNWRLRGQLSGYVKGARIFLPPTESVAGCVIRGLGIMKQSISFEQAIVSRPDWQVDRWWHQLQRDVQGMIRAWELARSRFPSNKSHLAYDQALDSACSAFGGCGFTQLCDSADPTRWYDDYEIRPWNPLEREGEGIAT